MADKRNNADAVPEHLDQYTGDEILEAYRLLLHAESEQLEEMVQLALDFPPEPEGPFD